MADIVVFSPEFVSYKFIQHLKVIQNNIELIIKEHNGQEIYSFTQPDNTRESLYEFPEGGCVQLQVVTELSNMLRGVGISLNAKKYSGAAYTLFCGFKKQKEYSSLKAELEILAKEVEENYT